MENVTKKPVKKVAIPAAIVAKITHEQNMLQTRIIASLEIVALYEGMIEGQYFQLSEDQKSIEIFDK
jgi:hypothetical protein